MKVLNIRLDSELLDKIRQDAKQKDRTTSYVVRELLRAHYTPMSKPQPNNPSEGRKMGRMKKVNGVWVSS